MRKVEKQDAILFIRATKELHRRVEAYATERHLSVAGAVRELLRSALDARGYAESRGSYEHDAIALATGGRRGDDPRGARGMPGGAARGASTNCGNCYRSLEEAPEARSYACTRCGAPSHECATCVRIAAQRGFAGITTCAGCSLRDEVHADAS